MVKSAETIDKAWVFLTLSEFSFSYGDSESSEHYVGFAMKLISKNQAQNQFPSYLSSLITLWQIDSTISINKIDNITFSKFTSEINHISNSNNNLIKGYCFYLLGRLFSFVRNTTESVNCFNNAINVLQGVDLYYLSLAQLELAKVCSNLDFFQVKELISIAQRSLKKIKKFSEAAKATDFLAEVSPSSKINQSVYQNIGSCLFISPAMQQIKQKLEMIAGSNRNDPVLILGSKGCGKERIAVAINELSEGNKPYFTINCPNISQNLFESTMFGHRKGAFTGATDDKAGLFELVGDGVLFLDEIGDMPIDCQAKLLRVLQYRDFARVGEENKTRKFSGRVVAATNKPLEDMVMDGTFRADLLDRLKFWVIDLPPLDKRREEILPLAEFFLEMHGQDEKLTLSQSAKNYLLKKDHPANIRGLEIDICKAIVSALAQKTSLITIELFQQQYIQKQVSESDKSSLLQTIEPYDLAMDKYASKILSEAVEICGSKSLAMHHLELQERTFFRLLKKYSIR